MTRHCVIHALFMCVLAARMLYTGQTQYEDIENHTLIDLGIGTGMLSIASCLLDAEHVFGLDCDTDALGLCQTNIEQFDLQSNIDLIQADLRRVRLPIDIARIRAETILMNPPFGTKPFSTSINEQDEYCSIGIDMHFLYHASQLATHSIYSLHKTSTREHILKKAHDWNMKMDVLAVLQFDIAKLEKKRAHRTASRANNAPLKPIEVDFIRFEIKDH
jgi:rRNA N6-adenosine-methyltransferase METTL5